MSSRSLVMILGAAALPLLAAGTALAGDIPANRSSRAKLTFGAEPNVGIWEKDGDSDWYRVSLAKGRTYSFGLDSGSEVFKIRLRNAAGRILIDQKAGGLGGHSDTGLEFTVRTKGTYFVEVIGILLAFSPTTNASYRLLATIDCAAGPATDCTIAPGQTRRRVMTWFGDVDWFRTSLRAGQSYSVVLVGSEAPEVAILSAGGQVLVADDSGGVGDAVIQRFVPRTSGTYYIRARNLADQQGSPYTLTLSQP